MSKVAVRSHVRAPVCFRFSRAVTPVAPQVDACTCVPARPEAAVSCASSPCRSLSVSLTLAVLVSLGGISQVYFLVAAFLDIIQAPCSSPL